MTETKHIKDYEDEIIEMVKKRNGNFSEWLRPQVESAAMNREMLAKIHSEIIAQQHLTFIASGSMGQQKKEINPLIPIYDKLQRTLLLQYEALGLNYKTTPSKVKTPTAPQDETDKLIGALRAIG